MIIHNFVKMATFGVVIVFSLALSTSAFAQAWLPPKGIGFFSIAGQGVDTSDHLFSDGTEFDLGDIRSRSIFFNTDYGLTRRMALSGTIGLVESKYRWAFRGGSRPGQWRVPRRPSGPFRGSPVLHAPEQDF